ncbi:HlyD family type I secretion periplasmic adaptor subunit [Chitinimonas sp. BJB300]|uniref:HlyD family type I secretion periplasmic adaptor subunit n=1 Tax=Chitinimonas sp. BJB300 TaxID=1559339 RepID=UPI000C0C766C|nr:HlyD family type I secretion periplasmic adaptor subunit [Chitinimonas sp. BJB300]PHV11942.1 hemolysin secretion protein D [Chitinimonas sp. BJB300]TSJ84464.1 HlyD family type I secretion periplasmic adaptor subunit [Chitinimonas sp. BJB300]
MLKFEAFKGLLQRYRAVWQAAWAIRDQLEPKPKLGYEAQFLPAALELQETPPSPIPRLTMTVLISLFLIALLWSIFGKIDVVAVAQGKVIPDDRTKIIQSPELAIVRRILVRDGQHVRAGETLVQLDATSAGADRDRLGSERGSAALQVARAQAMIDALNKGQPPRLQTPADVAPASVADEHRLLAGEYAELQARLAALDEQTAQRRAELGTSQQRAAKLQDTLPIVKQRAEDFRGLADKNFVAKHALLEKEQALMETQRDLATEQSRSRELDHAIAQNLRERSSLLAQAKRAALDQLNQAQIKASSLTQELVKAEQRNTLLTLKAPVDGVVQQLAVHTVGGVVKEADPLLQVVPQNDRLVVEAQIENKDIGFVYAGQEAEVKVETFSFTKYGTLSGKVLTVSNDAVQDEKRGLIYPARVQLDKSSVRVENKQVNLSPGMAVTAEIKIGKRRVIEYFLSPLSEHLQESLRER